MVFIVVVGVGIDADVVVVFNAWANVLLSDDNLSCDDEDKEESAGKDDIVSVDANDDDIWGL